MMVSNPYALQFFINMLLFAYLATGWNIIGGYAGQMALGNGVYFGIGAYVSTAYGKDDFPLKRLLFFPVHSGCSSCDPPLCPFQQQAFRL